MMHRDHLLYLLTSHRPFDENEGAMALRLRSFVETQPDCFNRRLKAGHITGSAWIVDPGRTATLLVLHRRLGRWLQPGGHCENDGTVLATALREAREETGLTDIRAAAQAIFDVDVHTIPAKGAEPEHFHYDVRFLFEADPDQPLAANSESRAVRWIPFHRVTEFTAEESVLRMVRKTFEPAGLRPTL